MPATDMTDESLVAFWSGHPDVHTRVGSIALAMENASEDRDKAHSAEECLVEEIYGIWAARRFGFHRQAPMLPGSLISCVSFQR